MLMRRRNFPEQSSLDHIPIRLQVHPARIYNQFCIRFDHGVIENRGWWQAE